MPRWLSLTLMWGGLALAVVFAIALILVEGNLLPSEAGATPAETTAPVTLYWILLIVGVVALVIGFAFRKPKPGPGGQT